MSEPADMRWYCVAEAGAIPLREGRRVQFGDYDVALFNLGGSFVAVDNRCPHRQGPLADGIVAGTHVFCPLHAWKICLEDGQVAAGGEGRVKTYPVQVKDRRVYIAFGGRPRLTTEQSPCA